MQAVTLGLPCVTQMEVDEANVVTKRRKYSHAAVVLVPGACDHMAVCDATREESMSAPCLHLDKMVLAV
jgi:hypothetical protein